MHMRLTSDLSIFQLGTRLISSTYYQDVSFPLQEWSHVGLLKIMQDEMGIASPGRMRTLPITLLSLSLKVCSK